MTKAEFKRLIRTNFEPILGPYGFLCGGSANVVFYRHVSNEIVHVLVASALRSVERYDITVFATSPVIENEFESRFPDGLHIVNAPTGYLSPEEGVSDYQKLYFCGNPDAFMNSFRRDAAPALANIAIPYLDKIQTMDDLIPTIRAHGMLGPALLHVGRLAEAKQHIEREIRRLSELPLDKFGQVERALAFQRNLLVKTVAH